MTTPANPDGPGTPAPNGWGEPPRYGQYAPGADAPAAPHAAPQPGLPHHGQQPYGQQQYGGQQYGQGQYGQQPPAPGGPGRPGLLPPVAEKPAIIPLRPLSLGEIYDGAFQSVRHNPGVVLGFTTIVIVIAGVIGALLSLPLTSLFTDLFGQLMDEVAGDPTADPDDMAMIESVYGGMLPGTYGVALGGAVPFALAMPLAMGGVAVAVSESAIDRRISLGETWRRVGPRWWFLIAVGLLQGLVILLFVALVIAAVTGMFLIDEAFGVVGIFLGFAGYLVFIAWFTVKFLLVSPAMVLERQGFWATVTRGWKLMRGVFWRTFGIALLTVVILWVIGQVLATPIGMIMGIGAMSGDPAWAAISSGLIMLITYLMQAIFLGAVVALLYIDTRMRREGLDVQLAAAAAER